MNNPILYLVTPCYNESETLEYSIKIMSDKINQLINEGLISGQSRIVVVDDGSKDNSWSILSEIQNHNKAIIGIKLSRNKGHQNAIMAGIEYASKYSDCSITIDVDLQDDINAVDEMIKKYLDGYEVVYGVRNKRETDTFFKRFTAESYYKLLMSLGCDIVYNHADFRLLGKNAMKALGEYTETNLYIRGIIPMIGYKSCEVKYDRNERTYGKSKYPLSKMLKLAWEGITSLSVKPIRILLIIGFLMLCVSAIIIIISIIQHFTKNTIIGWTSLHCAIWGIGGINLLAIGIVGEYVAKTYLESKHRPKYFVERILSGDKHTD